MARVRLADGGSATAGDPLARSRSSAAEPVTPLPEAPTAGSAPPSALLSPRGTDDWPHAPTRRGPGGAVVFGGLLVAGLFAVAGVVIAAGVDKPTAATAVPAAGVTEIQAAAASGSTAGRPDDSANSPTVGADVGMSLGRAAVVGPIVPGPLGDFPTNIATNIFGDPTAPVLRTPAALSDPDGSDGGPLAPATVSTLSQGDPGFGWPATAFGTAPASSGS